MRWSVDGLSFLYVTMIELFVFSWKLLVWFFIELKNLVLINDCVQSKFVDTRTLSSDFLSSFKVGAKLSTPETAQLQPPTTNTFPKNLQVLTMDLKRVGIIPQKYKDLITEYTKRAQSLFTTKTSYYNIVDLIKHTILL